MFSINKDLQTTMNERVNDKLWVTERCVGESVVMEIGDIYLGSTKVTGI